MKRHFSMIRLSIFSMLFSFGVTSQAANSTLDPMMVPEPLIKAMQEVHQIAAGSELRNLFMYRYAYYQGGFCANQNCQPQFIQDQMALMKNLMGADFPAHEAKLQFYVDEIRTAQNSTVHKDLDNLMSYRSADDVLSRGIFTTCVDFAKAIAKKAFFHGMKSKDLKFFWLMGKARFKGMCPTLQYQPAIMPRPLMHTIIAYRHGGQWYAMNSENPNPEIVPLGSKLPKRLSRDFIFSAPALVSGLPLTYAGAYSFADFIDGFANQRVLNIAASGIAADEPSYFVCR